jgi:hypothetical protein
MIQKSDTQFDVLLRTLILSPEESLRREALQEKIRARVASVFESRLAQGESVSFIEIARRQPKSE